MSRVSESSGSKEQMSFKEVLKGVPSGCSSLVSLISGARPKRKRGAIDHWGVLWCSPRPQDKVLKIRGCHGDGRQLESLHV